LFVCYEKALSRSCEEGLLKSAFPARAFLFKNGFRLEPEEAETVAVIRQVAAGEIDREGACRMA
jgi:prophage maintenance system killer protein